LPKVRTPFEVHLFGFERNLSLLFLQHDVRLLLLVRMVFAMLYCFKFVVLRIGSFIGIAGRGYRAQNCRMKQWQGARALARKKTKIGKVCNCMDCLLRN
jgi:hypothetical protein